VIVKDFVIFIVTAMVNQRFGSTTTLGTNSVNGSTYNGSTTMYQPGAVQNLTVSVPTGSGTVRKVSEVITSEKLNLPAHAYEQSSRKVSSVVVFEEAANVPQKNVRYVEVPQYEEVIKHVARKEIREVEKFVPKLVEEWVERVVEVPQVEEVVRHVEVPQVQEILKHVPKIEIIDRPFDVIKEVPTLQVNKVEKVIELGTELIEVPSAVVVEERVPVTHYNDTESMLIVSQKVKPVISNSTHNEVVVDIMEYEPEVIPVDIHVAKFVDQELVMMGVKETIHRCVTVSAAQYNSLLRYLNVHLTAEEVAGLPYLADRSGQVSFLPQEFQWFAPEEGLKIYGYRSGFVWGEGTPINQTNYNRMDEKEIQIRQIELDNQFQQIFHQFEMEKNRRVSAIDEFNRRSEQNARLQLGLPSPTVTHSTNNQFTALGYAQPTTVTETVMTHY